MTALRWLCIGLLIGLVWIAWPIAWVAAKLTDRMDKR